MPLLATIARRSRAAIADTRRGQQTCKVCGKGQDEIDYVASDRTWAMVVPPRYAQVAVCHACFTRFAEDRGLPVVSVFLVNGI